MSPENNSYTPYKPDKPNELNGKDLEFPGNIEAATIQSITAPKLDDIRANARKAFDGNVEQPAESPADSAEATTNETPTTSEITESIKPLTNFSERAVTDQLDAVTDLAKNQAPQPATNVDVEPKIDDIQNSSTTENTATDKKDDTAETDHTTQKDTVANIPEIVLPAVATPEEPAEVTDEVADVAPPETADVSPEDANAPDAKPEPVAAESAPKEEEKEEDAKQVEAAPASAEPEIVIVDDAKPAEKENQENQENPDQSAASNETQATNTTEVTPSSERTDDLEKRIAGNTDLLNLASDLYLQEQLKTTLRALHWNIKEQNNEQMAA